MKIKRGKFTTGLLVLAMSASIFTACGNSNNNKPGTKPNNKNEQKKDQAAINGAEDVTVEELADFDPMAGVTALDKDGKDATASIEVVGEVNTLKEGTYELTYKLKGTDLTVTRMVTVAGVKAALANGVYNYKFASPEVRHTFMAAAENYLLHNQYAGIPLFSGSGFALYSGRLQLVSEKYMPVLGFGTAISTMGADDSTVLMDDGKAGKAGEYTYRSSLSGNPKQWNQWKYDDGITSDVMAEYIGSLYEYEFNKDKTGYELNPSMADGNPIAIDGRELPGGKVVSKKWQIKIKDGLEWKFHPETDTSMITDTTINAVDFYETYKKALEEKWFRAISGGGDFCGGPQAVVNGQEFVDGKAKWEDVGIKLIDDNTIEFEFVDEQSQWNIKYGFGGFVMTPINLELYEALGEEFGTSEKTIAYTGVYYVDYYESDKIIRMKKNDKFVDADKYFYTGKTMTIIKDDAMRFQEFVAGKLDAISLPAANYEEYKSHPGIKRIPGATTYRFMINGLGTPEEQIKKFPDSKWTPEPILANQDFKMAMYHAVDRKKLAEDVLKTKEAAMFLFTDAYLVEAEAGIPYRKTEQGMAVGSDLSPSTYGFNMDAARAYYEKALDKLVSEGVYKDGDEIKFEFYYFSGSESQALMGDYLKDAFEKAFVSEKHNIKIILDAMPKEFPGIYYDHMMIGEFDTSIGGISGSALDAASFLDTYCADNRGGFTLNWGIDTSVPEITVSYKNNDGKLVKEMWSFDALQAALNGEVTVIDGKEEVKEEEETTEEN